MAHIFDPQRLHDISRRATGLPHREMVRTLIDDLASTYPGHIESREDWFMSVVGGATGIMTVLHCSLSEYLFIFGTPVGTEGFSGRYRHDIVDFLIAGEMWTYTEEACGARTITRPGEVAYLHPGQAKGFRVSEDSWMLEYGRGPVIACLPMALTGAVMSLDGKTIWKTLSVSTRLICRELRQGKV
jgi:hypothetical protein